MASLTRQSLRGWLGTIESESCLATALVKLVGLDVSRLF